MAKVDNPVIPPIGIAKERRRVEEILRRDAKDRQNEAARRAAITFAASGGTPDADAIVLRPTREWEGHGEYRSVMVRQDDNLAMPPVRTVRRITGQRIFKLHQSGILDDERYKACHIYRTTYEGAGFDGRCTTTRFNPTGVGSPSGYDHLPRTEREASNRDLFRKMSQWIEPRMLNIFDLIVLGDRSFKQAANEGRCSNRTAAMVLKLGSMTLVQRLREINILGQQSIPTPDIA